MTEKLLQYIWQFQYFNRSSLQTIAGESLEIINPGKINTGQGPDFTDALVKINDILLAGSVELHIKTSQWNDHGHQHDANYRNVVLHVVFENNEPISPTVPLTKLLIGGSVIYVWPKDLPGWTLPWLQKLRHWYWFQNSWPASTKKLPPSATGFVQEN